jgi:hypothetical protein
VFGGDYRVVFDSCFYFNSNDFFLELTPNYFILASDDPTLLKSVFLHTLKIDIQIDIVLEIIPMHMILKFFQCQ